MADEPAIETDTNVDETPLATDQADVAQKDGDQEAEAEDETGEESDENPEALTEGKKGRNRSLQGRIDDLTAQRREAERERDYYRALAEPQPAQNPPLGAKPDRDDFVTDDDFLEALADWKIDSRFAEQAQTREVQTLEAGFAARQAEAVQAIPDYLEVVGNSTVELTPHIQRAIMESDEGPKLAYHLAQNPAVAERLFNMSDIQSVMELARIGERLKASPAKSPSKAPAPISPLGGNSRNVVNLANASMEEYIEARRAQGAKF